jgi:cysteine-rich secretory family protein
LLKRIAFLALALLALFGGPLGMGRALAGPTADLTAMTNADRAAARLKALSTAGDLQSLAQRRADEMARSGKLVHTSNLGSKVSGWKRLGENVGRGPELRDIQTAFMNSPSHRENILDPGFSQLGVGVTFDGKEYLYVAVIFREPSGATTATTPPPPPPTTTPTTRAAAAPKPKPTTTTQAPTTTTTQPPTTTTTTTTAPPPLPPVEEVAAPPVEPPPAPVESTTTTAARPIFTDPDFLAQNFSDRIVPAVASTPLPTPGRPVLPIIVAAVLAGAMGLCVGRAWGSQAVRAEITPRRR